MQFTLKLSDLATAVLQKNTRLRVKQQVRAGKTYIAVRPSFRCKKSNHMVRVVDEVQDGKNVKVAHFRQSILEAADCPKLELGQYYLRDVGYGWFLIESLPEGADPALMELVDLVEFYGPDEEEPETNTTSEKKTDADEEDDGLVKDGTPAVGIRNFMFNLTPAAAREDEEEVATTVDQE